LKRRIKDLDDDVHKEAYRLKQSEKEVLQQIGKISNLENRL
jgi:hypothetical protein